MHQDAFWRTAEVVKVVDGDTLRLDIDLGWGARLIHDIRLSGVNTPENRGKERLAGHWVTDKVRQFLGFDEMNSKPKVSIHSKEFTTGKYGRCVCEVFCQDCDVSLNTYLLANGYAWPTNDNGSLACKRDIRLLKGIPEELWPQDLFGAINNFFKKQVI